MSTTGFGFDVEELSFDDLDIGVVDEPPEKPSPGVRRRRRKPSKYEKAIFFADMNTKKTTKTTEDDKFLPAGIEVGPWIFLPKDKSPEVPPQAQTDLRQKYGPRSPFCEENGYFFQIVVAGRQEVRVEGEDKPAKRGYLAVRKVMMSAEVAKRVLGRSRAA